LEAKSSAHYLTGTADPFMGKGCCAFFVSSDPRIHSDASCPGLQKQPDVESVEVRLKPTKKPKKLRGHIKLGSNQVLTNQVEKGSVVNMPSGRQYEIRQDGSWKRLN
jgi:hypothetical protein